MQQVETGLKSLGFAPEVRELSWFQDDYGLKAGEGEDDNEDEEEDDDDDDDDDDSSEDD